MVRSGLGGSGAGAATAGEETHKDGRRPAAMVVKLYYTTVTASREVKSQQSEVMRILESKGIQFELIDISVGNAVREEMRTKAGKPTAVPPQIFNGDDYCGDYQMFSEAVEDDAVEKFLKLD